MRKFLQAVLVCLGLGFGFGIGYAQQLPDPGFEDWTGAQFDGKEQPKYWNFSNVSQMGVDKNFAHKTTGRTGSALKIQDQFVGVLGLGATSPGYVALGHPWAYVSGLTSIEDATAGTYGGIAWTYRPDSMVVWVKRYYDSSVESAAGDHTKDENFNLVFYSWSGTSRGKSYRAKNLSCTDLSNVSSAAAYIVDEESDIRQATNGNECETKVLAKQIAEGWIYQKKTINNWTRIVVPIYYLNDDVPEKCNVILSAGNYPNFRANSGQYAGSTLDVDDIQLIYSSKVQKIYVGGREWKAFDPNNTTTEQVYSLGLGATVIPEISAVRGAGSITNVRGNKTPFPGRRLGTNECSITYGQVDGAPTVITVTAEDGSSTSTYRIKFVSQASNNARLSDIQVNGQTISGFNAYLTSYNVALPYGTTDAPIVTATAQDATATIQITQPTSVTGSATILVTAGDGTTTQTYTLSFSIAALTDVTLRNIFLDGSPLPGFQPSKSNYSVSLPLGTTQAPAVTWESAYPAGIQTIQLLNNSLESGAQIQVSLPGSTLSKTYKLTYKIEASSYSYLAGISLDGTPLPGFSPEQTVYSITLPLGTTSLPQITWTQGDPYQTVRLIEGGVEGTTRIEVTAANGTTTTYRLQFRTVKSSNNALSAIMLDGDALPGFDPDTLSYRVTLPAGTSTLPAITYTQGDQYQTVNLSVNQSLLTARLVVTAGDGSTRQYVITFEVQKSENAFLQMIYLDGAPLSDFQPSVLDYSLTWSTATMPHITVLPDEGQTITISSPSTYGTARIVVTPEEGTPNVYTVQFLSPDQVLLPAFPVDSFPASSDASLAALFIDGLAYDAFRPDQYDYTYPLPYRTTQVPAVVPVAGDRSQTITVAHGQVDNTTTIQVLAADGTTSRTYRVAFPVAKSSSTELLSIEIEGATITFDTAQHHYADIPLPYGTYKSPTITVERAEPEQSLLITEAPIGQTSSVVVTAQDGTQATYTFTYRVALPDKANELLAIVLDPQGALDLTQGPNFTIDLPYGADSLKILSVTKTYPEQTVEIVSGGVLSPTTITVHSVKSEEADKVYTLTPRLPSIDPAQLLDIQVDGVSIAQFASDRYSYVVSAPGDVPTVTYTEQTGAEVDVDANDKWVKLTVLAGEEDEYTHTYLVTFFYPNDFTFDLGFENWETLKNPNVTSQSGERPIGWNAPITAPTEGDAGTYYPWDNTHAATSPKTQGSRSAELSTTYLLTSAEAMPGFLSLALPSVNIGKWLLGVVEMNSSLAFGEGIPFRNTPDNIAIDYNLSAYKNNANGWMFVYNANGMRQVNYSQSFSQLTKNKWYTCSQPITYDPNFIPMNLDILICAAPSTVLSDYYTNFGVSRSTSTMYVDNLRFSYNSSLNGLNVAGTAATLSGNDFTATIDPETLGVPALTFQHPVPDQMPVFSWSEEVNGVRTATIRNYAEDLSYTDYTLTVTRPRSTNTSCTYVLTDHDLSVSKGSPYQTIAVTRNDTAFVITVTAESGAEAVYYAAWAQNTSTAAPLIRDIPGEPQIAGTSTAQLINIISDPVLNYDREYALDSVFMVVTSLQYELHVFGTSADTTYIIPREVSDNALLASMTTNDESVPGFYSETYDYYVTIQSLDSFSAVPQDPDADVQYTVVPIDDSHAAIFVLVTAADATTQRRYSVLANIRTLSSQAYLTAIHADDVLLSDFASGKYDYQIVLPAHSAIPTLSNIACPGATVETATVQHGASMTFTFTVTSEDGTTQRIYTVDVQVLPSEVCTLSDLLVSGLTIDGFDPAQTTYSIELPYGTTSLPDVDYVLADNHSTAVQNTDDKTLTITVTAEDGIHTMDYTIVFTIAKSTNADLTSILLDDAPLATFFADEHHYDISLPYGASIPTIDAEPADPAATVQINGTTITVTAEDGITTATYTLSFTYLPSTNANLLSIALDGVEQRGYQPDHFEYTDTVAYGATMPVVTWTVADEQQTVDTAWVGDTQLTITVTAGDGTSITEYTITFLHMLSSNCRLADLRVRGVTVDGFHPDSVEYTVTYPVATPESALFVLDDVAATPEDPDATLLISMEGTTAQILVTAPDGTRGVYVVQQRILLSTEARLRMIWLDGVEQRGFHPDTLSYTIELAQGANLPLIMAETIDTLASWDQGMPVEVENGHRVELYTTAQDGSSLTYKLNFQYAKWAASSTIDTDDYIFYSIGNGQFKAVTIGIGVQLGIYDLNGHLHLLGEVPTADPSDVEVGIDADGNQRIISVQPSAAGLVYNAPEGQYMFYVFFDSKTKKITKGGKFQYAR
ncbi:MAG: hypothetical protein IKG86_07215 [Paludibacteraceae bacterium]|nr:hypothetical protein [Paludibacteraceae bacterium]